MLFQINRISSIGLHSTIMILISPLRIPLNARIQSERMCASVNQQTDYCACDLCVVSSVLFDR